MQNLENIWNDENLIKVLKDGGVVVIPTDTIYGIVGQALNESTVERIYSVRKRSPDKPCIILIGDISELGKFAITLTEQQKENLKDLWLIEERGRDVRPTSVILDCTDTEKKFAYLHRGTGNLAFRLPSSRDLRDFFLKTGPLIAPSANPEGLPPAENISKAKEYFGDSVDFYLDGGEISGKASKIIKLNKDGTIDILRN